MTCLQEILNSIPATDYHKLVPKSSILTVLRGSLSHGTHVPPEEGGIDDIDLMSVFIEKPEFYLGLPQTMKGQDIKIGAFDTANYEFRHFMQLVAQGNPNVISALFTKERKVDAQGQKIIDNRNLFLTKRLYHSFAGYAHGQIVRMESFKDVENTCGCTGEFHAAQCQENLAAGRGSQKRFATGFMGEKRKGLVAKHGYDCKNAAHAIRLLSMAVGLFRTGELIVDRTGIDAQTLIDIKTGKWSLAGVKKVAEDLFAEMKDAKENSKLPEEPDKDKINSLMISTLMYELRIL